MTRVWPLGSWFTPCGYASDECHQDFQLQRVVGSVNLTHQVGYHRFTASPGSGCVGQAGLLHRLPGATTALLTAGRAGPLALPQATWLGYRDGVRPQAKDTVRAQFCKETEEVGGSGGGGSVHVAWPRACMRLPPVAPRQGGRRSCAVLLTLHACRS